MAQRSSRKRRKKRQRARSETGDSMARGYARGREKDEAARAALKPLAQGERPVAVTVAGVVALVLGVGNVIVYLAGYEIGGERPALVGVLLYSGLMLVAAWGCFNVRYWAVLGMQALLGLSIVLFSLLVIGAKSILVALVSLVIVGLAGTLFWFLVKSMARIQMPERPGS